MKLASTISLPKEVKRMAAGFRFNSREDRRYFVRVMVELEYQRVRQLKQRGRGRVLGDDGAE